LSRAALDRERVRLGIWSDLLSQTRFVQGDFVGGGRDGAPTNRDATEIARKQEEIWNFAYGGNMDPRVLSERRRIDPLESVAGCLKDYRLAFNTRGFPWIEPAFANVERASGACVHGVLHRLTREQFSLLDRYEWGGVAYRHLELDVAAYDGREIRALVYSARYVSREKSPSCRYLTFLREGARHYRLDDDYIRMLDRHPCLDTPALSDSWIGLFERSSELRTLVMWLIMGTWKIKDRFGSFLTKSGP